MGWYLCELGGHGFGLVFVCFMIRFCESEVELVIIGHMIVWV